MKQIVVLGVGERSHGQPWVPMINGPDLALPYRVGWVWDPDPLAASAVARDNGARALDHPTDGIDRVDGAMITRTDPATYLDDARPFLERGLPVYLNRPMASSPAMARAIVSLADEHGAAITAGSSLYYSSQVADMRTHADRLGRLRAFTACTGAAALYMYLPHAIAVMHSVLGRDVEWVHAFGRWDPDSPRDEPINVLVHVQYAPESRFGPVHGTLQYMKGGHAGGYTLKLWGEEGLTPTVNFGDCDLYANILNALGPFFAEGQEPMGRDDVLAAVDIHYAVVASLEQDRPVRIAEMQEQRRREHGGA